MGLVLGSIPRNTEVTGTPSSASITAMASWEGNNYHHNHHHHHHHLGGEAGHGVTQLLQLEQEGGGQQVGPDRHRLGILLISFFSGLHYNDHLVISPHLTELDEAGPEPGEHLPQLHRVPPLQPLVLPDLPPGVVRCNIIIRAANGPSASQSVFKVTEKGLLLVESAFTFKTLLTHSRRKVN